MCPGDLEEVEIGVGEVGEKTSVMLQFQKRPGETPGAKTRYPPFSSTSLETGRGEDNEEREKKLKINGIRIQISTSLLTST